MLKQTFVLSLPFLLVIPLTLFWFGVSKCSDRSIRAPKTNNNTNINERKVPVGADKDESGEQKHSKATTSVSATVFGGATHLKREELKGLFQQAASRNGQTD